MRHFTVHPLCHKTSSPNRLRERRRPAALGPVRGLGLAAGGPSRKAGKIVDDPTHTERKSHSFNSAFFSLHREPFLPPTFMRQWQQQDGEEARVNDTGTNGTRRIGCDTHSPQRLYPHGPEHGVAGLFPPSDIGLLPLPEYFHDADKALRPLIRADLRITRDDDQQHFCPNNSLDAVPIDPPRQTPPPGKKRLKERNQIKTPSPLGRRCRNSTIAFPHTSQVYDIPPTKTRNVSRVSVSVEYKMRQGKSSRQVTESSTMALVQCVTAVPVTGLPRLVHRRTERSPRRCSGLLVGMR